MRGEEGGEGEWERMGLVREGGGGRRGEGERGRLGEGERGERGERGIRTGAEEVRGRMFKGI